jgi:hypothetical protein
MWRAFTETEKAKMILNDKQDCIDSIAKVLERTAAWRKVIAGNRWRGSERKRAQSSSALLGANGRNAG